MSTVHYWAKAPLRLGLAGGGTDVSPFCDLFGGAVANAAINLFATAHITPIDSGHIIFHSVNKNLTESWEIGGEIKLDGMLRLLKATYVYLLEQYGFKERSIQIVLNSDVAVGSGLGSSSTCTVVLVSVLSYFFGLSLSKEDIVSVAFTVERKLLNIIGGRQDQYAAVYGGINFIEFGKNGQVNIKPIRLKKLALSQLNNSLVLYSSGRSRISSEIIVEQIKNVKEEKSGPVQAMHNLKGLAYEMKASLEAGDIKNVGRILNDSWRAKRKMAKGISNDGIQSIIELALTSGATGGKVSGAGGGGFMFFFCPKNERESLIELLTSFGGRVVSFRFESEGVRNWKETQG